MRWAAALLVFLSHIKNFGYFGGTGAKLVDWAFGRGSIGVSFFFILSGFVLAWSVRDGERAVTFWRNRIARVYPLHLVTAAIAVVLAFTLVPKLRPSGVPEALANVFLVSSWRFEWWQALNPVSWTLTCEAFFYALFPLLYAGLRRLGPRALTAVAAGSVALVMVLAWVDVHHGLGAHLSTFPLFRLPEFVLGAATACLVRLGAWRGPNLDVAVALTVVGYFLTRQVPWAYGVAACTVIGFGMLIPAAAVADLKGLPSSWRRSFLVRLGEWSFAFYLIHVLVLWVGQELFGARPHLSAGPALAAAAAAFLVSLTLAWLLHIGIEKPVRRVIVGRSRRRSAGVPA